MTYHVTRYSISEIDSGTRRTYLTLVGEWTPDRAKAERFATAALARQTAKRFPGAVVDGFREEERP